MRGDRLKIIAKWAVFLVLVSFLGQLLGGFISGLLFQNSLDNTLAPLVPTLIGLLITLPFAYYFSYKAVIEYLSGGSNRLEKHIGISISFGVLFFATAIGGVISYFLTGKFNLSVGLLPILLGLIAGRKAEAKFVKK